MRSTDGRALRIGVLALQGAFREHIALLKTIPGVHPTEVRTVEELYAVSGLIIPGGESTTMALVAQRWGLLDALVQFRKQGRPIWGTCAGLILLAEKAEGVKQGGQALIGGLDVLVARNFFGAQIESFETEMHSPPCLTPFGREPFRGVFIRAPAILEVGEGIEILSTLDLDEEQSERTNKQSVTVAVRSRNCLATAFHPELTGDNRWHQFFAAMVSDYLKEDGSVGTAGETSSKCIASSDLPVYGKDVLSVLES